MRATALRLIGSWSLVHLGYRAALIALPLLAIEQTGSAWTVGLVSGAGGIPAVTAPWWTGRLQRRLSSARALAGLMVGEGIATLVVPAAAGVDALTPAVMIAAGLAIGVLNAVSGPLNASLVASIGDRADARRGDSGSRAAGTGAARLLALQETAVKVSMTVAPLVALPMVTVVGAAWTVALEGMLTLAAAGLVATLRLSSRLDAGSERPPRVRALLARHREIGVGWTVRGLGCAAWFAFTLCLTVLGQREGSGVLLATVGLASYSGGAIAGSALGMVSASSSRPALVNSLSWVVAGVGWLIMGVVPTLPVIAIAAAVMGLAVPAGNAATTAMVTRSYTGLERRAALTAQATVVTGSSTMGMLLGGPLIAMIGPRACIIAAGLVVAAVAAAVALGEYSRGRRGTRPEPGSTVRKVTHDGERWPGRELSRL
jgi:predicted MFS family arabinose efflux permease